MLYRRWFTGLTIGTLVMILGMLSFAGYLSVQGGSALRVLAAQVESTSTPHAPTSAPTNPQAAPDQTQTQRRLFGVIEAVNGNVLDVRDARREQHNIHVTNATRLARIDNPGARTFRQRLEKISVDELAPGTRVLIFGERSNTDFNARAVIVLPETFRLRRPMHLRASSQLGVVTAITENELTLQRAPRTLSLGIGTKIIVVGKPNAQAQDLHAGDKIIALGGRNHPQLVIAAPAEYTRDNLAIGRITGVSPNQASLQTARGKITIVPNINAQILNTDLQPLAFDLLENSSALVLGTRTNGVLHAQLILARTP
jgi:hypothetical protein